ncbi:DNA helicase [Agrilactobacillus composti DSM 18527 = JCM 14202]|uniref:DNA helicase n=1 Tax=Agrilactobacillus composti DSM 18527 = JCM 14202 TaxID=1423734 RepID=X0PGN1_9LACO|nr:helicase-related protein [Agrilactobacillus composti]KRM31142.1 DNA helicase [Agrilactobacillus composti DSM 18527 = JCM 14202]GAF41073.1 ComF operon protein A, DNA transporter ATPase [Agrilactobacillus composti DSM 18527 = JCM 14202]
MNELLYGRRLTTNELGQLGFSAAILATLPNEPAMFCQGHTVTCQRCSYKHSKSAVQLPKGNYYCPECLPLGRITSEQKLYHLPEPNDFVVNTPILTWSGSLTPGQAKVSADLIAGYGQQRAQLLWAVTGAGKTEMLFPLLAAALAQGDRIGLASPRIDVCNELFPRLQQAFANTSMQLLHGQQNAPYAYTQLTVSTTHQLLRFYRAFDLLIIDEVDAFPFVGNQSLNFAAEQALKSGHGIVNLTATPTKQLQQQSRRQELQTSYLTRRFHGRLLPLPKLRQHYQLAAKIAQGHLPKAFWRQVRQSLERKRQVLVFLPRIAQLAELAKICQVNLTVKIAAVYAGDEQRQAKITAFRQKQVQLLLTTTILERGVTFSNIDVYVLQADAAVFNAAALVQIAGRAGRDAKFANGQVSFFYEHYTKAIQTCCRQIKYMNAQEDN